MIGVSPRPAPPRELRDDREAELLLIAEVSQWLAKASPAREPEALKSVMDMLDRQQRVAANRAFDRPIDD